MKKQETHHGDAIFGMTVEHPPFEAAHQEHALTAPPTPREAARASMAKVIGLTETDAAYVHDGPLLAMARAHLATRKGARK